jgi:hypothetical protein
MVPEPKGAAAAAADDDAAPTLSFNLLALKVLEGILRVGGLLGGEGVLRAATVAMQQASSTDDNNNDNNKHNIIIDAASQQCVLTYDLVQVVITQTGTTGVSEYDYGVCADST